MGQGSEDSAEIRHRKGNLKIKTQNSHNDKDYLSISFPRGNLTYSLRESMKDPWSYLKGQCENHEKFIHFLENEKEEIKDNLCYLDGELLNEGGEIFENHKEKIAGILSEDSSFMMNYETFIRFLRSNLNSEEHLLKGYSTVNNVLGNAKGMFSIFYRATGGDPELKEYTRLITNSYNDINGLYNDIIKDESEIIKYKKDLLSLIEKPRKGNSN